MLINNVCYYEIFCLSVNILQDVEIFNLSREALFYIAVSQ